MYDYIKGKIINQGINYIILDNSNIGYRIYVANPYNFTIDSISTVYLYNHIREEEYTLYGFTSLDERELFLKLINVKGLGPKMALPMFATGSVTGIMDAITRENIIYLTKFPKIGDKLAKQIILDLKGKVGESKKLIKESDYTDLVSVLESLGYKSANINKVLPQIDIESPVETQVKEALKLLLK